MRELIKKRIEEIVSSQKEFARRINELDTERQNLVNKVVALQGAREELEILLKKSEESDKND